MLRTAQLLPLLTRAGFDASLLVQSAAAAGHVPTTIRPQPSGGASSSPTSANAEPGPSNPQRPLSDQAHDHDVTQPAAARAVLGATTCVPPEPLNPGLSATAAPPGTTTAALVVAVLAALLIVPAVTLLYALDARTSGLTRPTGSRTLEESLNYSAFLARRAMSDTSPVSPGVFIHRTCAAVALRCLDECACAGVAEIDGDRREHDDREHTRADQRGGVLGQHRS
jgi:hypothetical protein